MLGDDGNQIGAHSCRVEVTRRVVTQLKTGAKTAHSALSACRDRSLALRTKADSGIHFGMDDWGKRRFECLDCMTVNNNA